MALTPSFDITSEPRQLGIRGTIDGVEVTRASFKECDDPLPPRVDPDRHNSRASAGHGYALALLRHLEQAEPRGPLIDSPVEMDTEAGIAAITAARRYGIAIHTFGCFRTGKGCTCAVSVQAR